MNKPLTTMLCVALSLTISLCSANGHNNSKPRDIKVSSFKRRSNGEYFISPDPAITAASLCLFYAALTGCFFPSFIFFCLFTRVLRIK